MHARTFALSLCMALTASLAAAQSAQAIPDPFRLTLQAPIATWDEAIPLGNGMTGGLLWGEGRTLRLSLDRADLWDLRTPEIYKADDWTYATIQRLVNARDQKELVRRFDAPFEEIPYPTKLPGARLELTFEDGGVARAFTLDMKRAVGTADFGAAQAEAFFSATERVAFMRIHGAPPSIALLAPASLGKLGYAAARVGRDKSSAWLVQDCALGLVYAVHVSSRRSGSHTDIAIAIVSRHAGDPLAAATSLTTRALSRGFVAARAEHERWWRRFWAQSSVTVPDARIQQHYNLVQYFYGAASRRGAPPMPLQGVWTADAGTLPPWKGDFHFDLNVQLSYWAYLQAGHFDEGAAYLDFMWHLVPVHRAFARRFFNAAGIVVPGVMALDGQPLGGWGMYSLSPVQGAWVAQAFYLHWRYTADPAFLSERAYPYCVLVADGLLSLLRPDANGKLTLPLSSSPEIHDNTLAAWMTPLTNYDLSLIRWLFGALEQMAAARGQQADAAKWARLLARLDDLGVDERNVLKVSPSETLTESHRHLSHLMAIHPLGTLNADGSDRDRTVIAASLDNLEALGTKNWVGYSFSWAACMEARAGRAETARRYLDAYASAFILRNGFHANGDQTKSGYSNFTYRPFTLEGNFAAAQAVHEMLLQSWDGVIRVFPAVSDAWPDASFQDLRAEGGYRVKAVRRAGRTTEMRVTATRTGRVHVRDPFEGTGKWRIVRESANAKAREADATERTVAPIAARSSVLEFQLAAGSVLIGSADARR